MMMWLSGAGVANCLFSYEWYTNEEEETSADTSTNNNNNNQQTAGQQQQEQQQQPSVMGLWALHRFVTKSTLVSMYLFLSSLSSLSLHNLL